MPGRGGGGGGLRVVARFLGFLFRPRRGNRQPSASRQAQAQWQGLLPVLRLLWTILTIPFMILVYLVSAVDSGLGVVEALGQKLSAPFRLLASLFSPPAPSEALDEGGGDAAPAAPGVCNGVVQRERESREDAQFHR